MQQHKHLIPWQCLLIIYTAVICIIICEGYLIPLCMYIDISSKASVIPDVSALKNIDLEEFLSRIIFHTLHSNLLFHLFLSV